MPYNELVTHFKFWSRGGFRKFPLRQQRGIDMKEKEYYKQQIIKTINKIDRIDILMYLNRLIDNLINNKFISK